MVPAGNKAKRLSLVNHTTRTNHHHQLNNPYQYMFRPTKGSEVLVENGHFSGGIFQIICAGF